MCMHEKKIMYLFIVFVQCIVCDMPLTQTLGIAEQFILFYSILFYSIHVKVRVTV